MGNDRYARLEQMDWWNAPRVRQARALVAGGGALGNEVLKNLLLIGWGTVIVVDFDTVERSNLSRAILFTEAEVGLSKTDALVRGAARVNPDCHVIGVQGDLRREVSAGLAARMDVIFGCVDNVAARMALSDVAGQVERPFIDGGLSVWQGTVSVFRPWDGPCYTCGLSEHDVRDLSLRRSCLAYARRAAAAQGVATTPTVASVVAALMVQIALKWLHGWHEPKHFPAGSQIRIDTLHDRFWKVGLPRNPECVVHPTPVTPTACPCALDDSWNDIFAWWRDRLGTAGVVFELPITILEAWQCPHCGRREEVGRAHLAEEPVRCTACGEDVIPAFRNQLLGREPYLDRSPRDMGFPPWTRLAVRGDNDVEESFELISSADNLALSSEGAFS